MAYVPLPPRADRLARDDAIFSWRPGPVPFFGNVSAVRATDDGLPGLVEAAQQWFADRGREDFVWFLGPSATPAGIADRLVSWGAVPIGGGTAMLLDDPVPPAADADIRRVTSADELLTFRMLLTESGGRPMDDDSAREVRAGNDQAWEDHQQQAGQLQAYLARIDDVPVAAGGLLLTEYGVGVLAGGGTAPSARGRGCYRALVHARWVAAQQAGLTGLAVQASPDSAPILARMGFRSVCSLTLLRQPV